MAGQDQHPLVRILWHHGASTLRFLLDPHMETYEPPSALLEREPDPFNSLGSACKHLQDAATHACAWLTVVPRGALEARVQLMMQGPRRASRLVVYEAVVSTETGAAPPLPPLPRERVLRAVLYQTCNLTAATWPPGVRHLTIPGVEGVAVLPSTLERLTLGAGVETALPHTTEWPSTLTFLELERFVGPVADAVLPPSLKTLKFGSLATPLAGTDFPRDLEVLDLGPSFNGAITGVQWPDNLRSLKLGRDFTFPLEGVTLPRSLEEIALGDAWNNPVELVAWPPGLKKLQFGHAFNSPITRVTWPPALEEVRMGSMFNQPLLGVNWPAGCKSIAMGLMFDQPVEPVVWPPALEMLRFSLVLSHPLEGLSLPPTLTELRLHVGADRPLAALSLPPALEVLHLGPAMCGDLDPDLSGMRLPPSLRVLRLRGAYNRSLPALPEGLQELVLGHKYNVALDEGAPLPRRLRVLIIGDAFAAQLRGDVLPAELQVLALGQSYTAGFELVALPPALRRVSLGAHQAAPLAWPERVMVSMPAA